MSLCSSARWANSDNHITFSGNTLLYTQLSSLTDKGLVIHTDQLGKTDLEIELAKQDWNELQENLKRQIEILLGVATSKLREDDLDFLGIFERESTSPLVRSIQKAMADAVVSFSLDAK